MRAIKPATFFIPLTVLFLGCADPSVDANNIVQDESASLAPSHVEIVETTDRYELVVNGEPFHIKGVGLDSDSGQYFDELVEAGGNAFRTWRTKDADVELAAAAERGLMVAVGLDIEKELHGFDYNDEAAVKEQLERLKDVVNMYKDHPNLLVWVAGNELNLLFDAEGALTPVNPKAYDALAELVDYIHEVDPHHPVTTTFAGFIPEHIEVALERVPNLDFISVQVYGDLATIQQRLAETPFEKPFMVTEYGPLGHWERPTTAWAREIEEPSGVKAAGLARRIQAGLGDDQSGKLIGNFAFLWGDKQERTPTWYGMFNPDGAATARVDEMQKFWTGEYPSNRAPLVHSISVNDLTPEENIYLEPGMSYTAKIEVTDPESDPLSFEWAMLSEVKERSQGGAFEQRPDDISFEFTTTAIGEIEFTTPAEEGEYRLFAYVKDPAGKVGNANAPFYIRAAD